MLNRLYIVIGVLAILALGAAFIVPSFVRWSDYRERMEVLVGDVLGAPVRIEGEIDFSLLPHPRLQFSKVSAGPADAPTLTVERVQAEFSLIDFIRDSYTVTRLHLEQPAIAIKVGADGSVVMGLSPAAEVKTANISVANAEIGSGTISLSDSRSGEVHVLSQLGGEIRLEALRGPFSFQGTGTFSGKSYALRLTTGAVDAAGAAPLATSIRSADGGFSLTAEGVLSPGVSPKFVGVMLYRQPPSPAGGAETSDAGQGDLVMTSQVEATPGRVLLSEYIVIPDENRPATRLQGAAEVTLGVEMSFNAVISGGVVALPPRDATAEGEGAQYELVRLLAELPLPAAPGIPGTVGIDIAELDLRAFALRNVRLDAAAHDGGWTVRRFSGEMPGETELVLAGEVIAAPTRPEFAGTLSLRSSRLDLLSALWRKPAAGNPLFNVPGSIEAKVDIVGETLSISEGRLTLDGESRPFAVQLGFGAQPDIHLNSDLGALDADRSAMLLALLPNLDDDPVFATTFPKGEFSVVADALTVDGLQGSALNANGSWDGGVLVIDQLSASDLGGARFDVAFTAFGSFAKPELSGTGTVSVTSADAPALQRLYTALQTPPAVTAFLERSLPADLALKLGAPSGDGAQSLMLSGTAGAAQLAVDARLEAGFLRALDGPLTLALDLQSSDPVAMTAQLGLGASSLMPEGVPMRVVGQIKGNFANSLETTLLVSGGDDSLGFSGNVVVTDPDAFSGKGTLKAELGDAAALAEWAGIAGVQLPAFSGSATLEFDGPRAIRLDGIDGRAGGAAFSGRLAYRSVGSQPTITGEINAGAFEVTDLVGTLVGPAALLAGEASLWPDGPLATGDLPRSTAGRVTVTAPAVTSVGVGLLSDVSFDLDWDATTTRLRGLSGHIGGGTFGAELAVCCAGSLVDKQFSGRLSVDGVAIDALLPERAAEALDGTISGNARFDATGGSLQQVLAAMTGEGTFTASELAIAHLDPAAITEVAALETLLETPPDQLTMLLAARLDSAPFVSPGVSGAFTVAGGVLRSPNLSIEGAAGKLFGSGSIRLADLGLSGSYVLSATDIVPAALVDTGSATVSVGLAGTLVAPDRVLDASRLVDAILVRAYEAEVARLEKLRAEDEARRKAQADEQARLEAEATAQAAAEQKRLADEAAIREADRAATAQAAEAVAARRAAEEAAARAAQEEAMRRAIEQAGQPMDLGI